MTTIATRIQKSLTEKIVRGELRPGHRLDEKSLASDFGVSRTPIREALRELGAKGLIDLAPHRGGIVAKISIDKLADMLDAECEIEALCAKLASQRMNAIEKGTLLECHQNAKALTKDRDEIRYLAINQTFHDMICDGAHNATLATVARDLRARLAAFRQSQGGGPRIRLLKSHQEHEFIVDAIMASDPDAAYEAMRRHNARLSSGVLTPLKARGEA